MLQKIQRVTLAGSSFTKIEFDSPAAEYMVKNFSESDIYVSFDADAAESNSVKIPAGYFQEVVANKNIGSVNDYKTADIYIKGTGEVEVQQLWLR